MNKRNSYRTTRFKTREESETGDLILSGYFINSMKLLNYGQVTLR